MLERHRIAVNCHVEGFLCIIKKSRYSSNMP